MTAIRFLAAGLAMATLLGAGGCKSIRESRGYITDPTLVASVQPGVDNEQSVQATLGHPSFQSTYGQPTWYYVSSTTGRAPFGRPRPIEHQVLAVHFDGSGNVAAVDRTGLDKVVFLTPDGDKTPTLGRERNFFEDLFGNIGAVGAGGPQQGQGPNGS
jgi:outer membrane protein assembly factor BamE (lipoprotein component of BamABCDE complex)